MAKVTLNLSDEAINDLFSFMKETGLSPNQVFLCILLHRRDFTTVITLQQKLHNFITYSDVEDLINRGYAKYTGESVDTNLQLSKLYLTAELFSKLDDKFYSYAHDFIAAYPSFLRIDGRDITSKAIDLDKEIVQKYKDYVGGKIETHFRIMDYLQKMKIVNNNRANMRIDRFLMSKTWETTELDHIGNSDNDI